MGVRIRNNLWQVGGNGLTDPSDAAIYLLSFGDKDALIDAGSGRGQAQLIKNIAEYLEPNVQLEYLLLTHCHFDHTGGAKAVRTNMAAESSLMSWMRFISNQATTV